MKLITVLAVLAGTLGASATTYYVSPDLGDDSRDGTTMATAFQSLSKVFGTDGKAAGHLAQKNTVVLSNGTYALSAPLTFATTTLRGWTGDPKDVILDGQDKTNCCVMKSGKCILSGVTVRRGKSWGPFINTVFYGGAGVYVEGDSSYVSNCIVRDCTQPATGSYVMGGGVMVTAGTIRDCRVENCHLRPPSSVRSYGGGICLYSSNTAAYDCFVTNCSIVATSSDSYGGGIGNYFEGYDPTVSNCTVIGCSLTNSAGVAAGRGGGISLTPGGKFIDCLVRDCKGGEAQLVALDRSGADYTIHQSRVSRCTVEGGTVRPISLCGSYGTIENTLVQNATLAPTASTYGFGISAAGAQNRIVSTVVRNCKSSGSYGYQTVYVGNGSIVSNCVVEGCSTEAESYSGAIYAQYPSSGLEIVDSLIISNEAHRASSLYVYDTTGNTKGLGVTVRNCYFLGNKSRNTCGLHLLVYRTNVIDHCTFAENTGGEYFRGRGFTEAGPYWNINACVFVNNCSAFDLSPTGYTYPISYCNVATDLGTSSAPPTFTKTSFSTGMAYVDAAAKDFRQAKGSSGIDVDSGAVMPTDWMKARGCRDLGDGTYALEQVGNHGILVTHPNARRRFSGAAPDIGCFEYRHPKGAAFYAR